MCGAYNTGMSAFQMDALLHFAEVSEKDLLLNLPTRFETLSTYIYKKV